MTLAIASRSSRDGRIVLVAEGVAKRYGGTHALRGVTIAFRAGEVHAIVGENGAGKSTLTRVLTGATGVDAGHIQVDGAAHELRTPLDGQRLGIRMVHQHDTLVPNLSVTENVLLGHLPRAPRGWIDWRAAHRRAAALFGQLGWPELDVRQRAGALSAAQRQIVEIAKAISIEPRVLILDEPTATLAHQDIERLFAFVRRLRDRGTAVIYISHHLDEIFALAERVTVLRDGALVATLSTAQTDKAGLIRMMVGRAIENLYPQRAPPARRHCLGVHGLARAGAFADVSFDVGAGEIVGMYGLVGSGRSEIARCIFGADRATAGTITWRDKPFAARSPKQALGEGHRAPDRGPPRRRSRARHVDPRQCEPRQHGCDLPLGYAAEKPAAPARRGAGAPSRDPPS